MSYLQKFKSNPNTEKVHGHLKLAFNKKLLLIAVIALAIPITVVLSSQEQDTRNYAAENSAPASKGYFIEFKEGPLATTRTISTSTSMQTALNERSYDLDAAHLTAKNNILGILGKSSYTTSSGGMGPASGSQVEILGEYKNVFNGLALNISAAQAEKILNESPYVEAIYPNYEVKIQLMDSAPMIGAVRVREIIKDSQGRAVDGKGVNVGVIDTGVDYKHPDLGSSRDGQTYNSKVVGGYDFVNMDSDPMDDNGHGTHVASIIAGNGALKGVAPGANIYAFKAFNELGNGFESSIVLAVEHAYGTHRDGDTTNDLDILNMSFGADCKGIYGPGCGPDAPLSKAVENAASEGIVPVVAAGNSGNLFGTGTITMPGAARSAITVGSINKSKVISSFSSRGPIINKDKDGLITDEFTKPDVVAPGEDICAAKLTGRDSGDNGCFDGNHIKMSGTSMAAPHVAGLAALILQKYPTWTQSQVKDIIKSQANNLGKGYDETTLNTQGRGMVDTKNIFNFSSTPPPPPPDPTPLQITAFQDSFVSGSAPAANYGGNTRIRADGNPKKISYLKFDLTPLAGKRIVSARLKLNIPSTEGAGSDSVFTIRKIAASSWAEGKLNFNNRPKGGTAIATFKAKGTVSLFDIDVENFVANNLGTKVSISIATEGGNELILISRESASNKPRLVVEYQ